MGWVGAVGQCVQVGGAQISESMLSKAITVTQQYCVNAAVSTAGTHGKRSTKDLYEASCRRDPC